MAHAGVSISQDNSHVYPDKHIYDHPHIYSDPFANDYPFDHIHAHVHNDLHVHRHLNAHAQPDQDGHTNSYAREVIAPAGKEFINEFGGR